MTRRKIDMRKVRSFLLNAAFFIAVFFVLPGAVFASDVMFWPAQEELTAVIEDGQELDKAVEEILEDELDIE